MTEIRSYTLSEIAAEYKVSAKTMRIWIKPIREELLLMYPIKQKRIRVLLPKQRKRIVEYLG
ncbi:MAG: hypothetical protein C0594_15110 [Marinilabiliales bacterium]|nr:MAG: hypothetical protein C0594_15110 [Marinilabiliales bacterium]